MAEMREIKFRALIGKQKREWVYWSAKESVDHALMKTPVTRRTVCGACIQLKKKETRNDHNNR